VNKAKRNLTVILVGVATAITVAAPAQADPITDPSFLGALNNAGIGYGDPNATTSLGQSVCPMLVQPGQSFASVASSMGNQGISPGMASFFTGIAIQMYCPQMMSSIGNGTFLNQLGGLNGLSGLQGIPGMSGIPGI
jgi:Protein of unknown function (DUF732)